MGGPFRAIVGGQARYKWSFAPASWIRVDNNSTQYFKLDELDDYIVPGQINKFINVDGISSVTGIFTAPPGVSQAAPTAGQIAQVWTYDVGAPGGPLGPSPGLLLPIGLDQPQHFHNHTHGSHSHSHGHGSHNHSIPNHNHSLGGPAAWITTGPGNGDGTFGAALSDHTHPFNGGSSGSDVTGNAVGLNTNLASVNTDATVATPAADTTLENVQHTHP